MSEQDAREVAAWRYEAPYDFYDMASLEELLDPERRERYHAVLSDGELAGFFCYGTGGQVPSFNYPDDGSLDIGLGLRPDLTGKGSGLEFVRAGLGFARRRFETSSFRLSVATFNERAIRTYERAGFRRVDVFIHHTGGGDHPFLLMAREA